MARTCTVCRHPKLAEIEKALLCGGSFRNVAQQFGVNPRSLFRHKQDHLKPIVKEGFEAARNKTRIMSVEEVWEYASAMCRYDPAEWTNQFGAFKDLREIDWEHRMAIKKTKRRDIYDNSEGEQKSIIGEVREYEGESRLGALKLMAQLHNLLPAPAVENTQINIFVTKTEAELDYFIEHLEWPRALPPAEAGAGTSDGSPPVEKDRP
jgi:hypothetical protein